MMMILILVLHRLTNQATFILRYIFPGGHYNLANTFNQTLALVEKENIILILETNRTFIQLYRVSQKSGTLYFCYFDIKKCSIF